MVWHVLHIMAPHGTAWDRVEPHGTAWNRMGPHGTAWDRVGPHGTIWHRMGMHGAAPQWRRTWHATSLHSATATLLHFMHGILQLSAGHEGCCQLLLLLPVLVMRAVACYCHCYCLLAGSGCAFPHPCIPVGCSPLLLPLLLPPLLQVGGTHYIPCYCLRYCRWEAPVTSEGETFIDRNGEVFKYVAYHSFGV